MRFSLYLATSAACLSVYAAPTLQPDTLATQEISCVPNLHATNLHARGVGPSCLSSKAALGELDYEPDDVDKAIKEAIIDANAEDAQDLSREEFSRRKQLRVDKVHQVFSQLQNISRANLAQLTKQAYEEYPINELEIAKYERAEIRAIYSMRKQLDDAKLTTIERERLEAIVAASNQSMTVAFRAKMARSQRLDALNTAYKAWERSALDSLQPILFAIEMGREIVLTVALKPFEGISGENIVLEPLSARYSSDSEEAEEDDDFPVGSRPLSSSGEL